jgi:hypothetical protein
LGKSGRGFRGSRIPVLVLRYFVDLHSLEALNRETLIGSPTLSEMILIKNVRGGELPPPTESIANFIKDA